jgi:hypothetical protein
MKAIRSFLLHIFFRLGCADDPRTRAIKVKSKKLNATEYQLDKVFVIPQRVPELYVLAQEKGYKGICDFDEIESFLKTKDYIPCLDGEEWCLCNQNPQAPKVVLGYVIALGYQGNGDCRSVGKYLRAIHMTPVQHSDGHWSIESMPEFAY